MLVCSGNVEGGVVVVIIEVVEGMSIFLATIVNINFDKCQEQSRSLSEANHYLNSEMVNFVILGIVSAIIIP